MLRAGPDIGNELLMLCRFSSRAGIVALGAAFAALGSGSAVFAQSQGAAEPKRAQERGAPKGEAKGDAKGKAAGAALPGGAQAALLASFGDWKAYATQGRPKICYALSQPTSRKPDSIKDSSGYLFVSFRPADKVSNEVALVMGFPTKDGGAAEAAVGSTKYELITKGSNAWVKNPAEEGQVIATMSKGKSLTVKATSGRGNATTDLYSLNGFGPALDRARGECK